jgi:rod shape-determining protein MreD
MWKNDTPPAPRANRVRTYAAIFALFFLEITLFNKLRIYSARPELLLIATIFFGFHFGAIRGLEAGTLAGALRGLFSVTAFGIHMFSFLLIGGLSGLFKEKLSKENFLMQIFFSGASVAALGGIYFLYLSKTLKCDMAGDFAEVTLVKGLYTGCATPLVFFILGKMFKSKEAE